MRSEGVRVTTSSGGIYYLAPEDVAMYRDYLKYMSVQRVAQIMRVNKIPLELSIAVLCKQK